MPPFLIGVVTTFLFLLSIVFIGLSYCKKMIKNKKLFKKLHKIFAYLGILCATVHVCASKINFGFGFLAAIFFLIASLFGLLMRSKKGWKWKCCTHIAVSFLVFISIIFHIMEQVIFAQ